jgi:isomerase DpgB
MAPQIQIAPARAHLTLAIDGADPLTPELVRTVTEACGRAEDAPDGGALLIRLTGRRPLDAGPAAPHYPAVHLVNKWERALRRLEQLPTATVATLTGDCFGLAADVLLATDYRIAGTGLQLRPATAGGTTWPGMALYRLAQQIGVGRARRIALFGGELSAWQALELRLVDEVSDDVEAALAAALDGLTGPRAHDVAVRRRLLMDASSISFEDALGPHLAACDRALRLTAAAS